MKLTWESLMAILNEYSVTVVNRKPQGEKDFIIWHEGWDQLNKLTEQVKSQYDDINDEDDVFEQAGYEWGFEDEYSVCDECQGLIHTEPTSYGWMPDYHIFDGTILCGDCIGNNPEPYINHIENNPKLANTILTVEQLEDLGYECIQGKFETGWYQGQNDSPQTEYEKYKDQYESIIFVIDSVGQFDTRWSIWGKNESDGMTEEERNMQDMMDAKFYDLAYGPMDED